MLLVVVPEVEPVEPEPELVEPELVLELELEEELLLNPYSLPLPLL